MASLTLPARALEGIRVLDLTGEMGNYCGKLFADLGAEVTLIEPPGGGSARRRGPFFDEQPGTEASLAFAYLNAGKKSIVLDLAKSQDRDILRHLVADADLLVEDAGPGRMASLGLGPEALAEINPALVYTSITPFGQTGPYADYAADDLTLLALGGMLYLGGYADGQPLAAYGQQAYLAASLFAAVASMSALLAAEISGRGERIDVSAQESVVMAMENAIQFYELEGVIRKRYGGQQRQAGSGVFRCADGFIVLLAGGIAANRFWKRFVAWMIEEGVEGAEEFHKPEWLEHAFLATADAKTTFIRIFERYALRQTKAELYQKGRDRMIPLAPIATPSEILASPQLKYRSFFVDVFSLAMGRSITMPGAPYQFSQTLWSVAGGAPPLDAHGEIIRKSLRGAA
jgi:benzylsuccinate CoA-transferase BbsE subunit